MTIEIMILKLHIFNWHVIYVRINSKTFVLYNLVHLNQYLVAIDYF